MPYLGDYLGHLLAEITNARVQADLEAVRVAELYASHPLLKNMPVPHFRLPTVTLDVPVAIKEVERAKKAEPAASVVLPRMRKSFDRLLTLRLKREGIELSDSEKAGLKQALDSTITSLKPPQKVPLSVTRIADELVSASIKTVRERKGGEAEPERLAELEDELKTAVHADFSKFLRAPARLNVLATTAELKEAGPSDILAHLHLSITEEAVEWTVIESKGKSLHRLVPE